jgi:hypothetical protein
VTLCGHALGTSSAKCTGPGRSSGGGNGGGNGGGSGVGTGTGTGIGTTLPTPGQVIVESSSERSLAHTGADLASLIGIALLLALIGMLMLRTTRREGDQ